MFGRKKDYNHYNERVNSATAERLLDLNRRFYSERAVDFSATRLRLQPGVNRLLDRLRGEETVLDLGCGNGELARSLSRRGHRGSYLGLDSSQSLLAQAGASSFSFPVRFASADLSGSDWDHAVRQEAPEGSSSSGPPFDVILCFAVLHHLPGASLRSSVLHKVHDLLASDGICMLSNWRFTGNPRMSLRIQPWSAVGLRDDDVDIHDHLLDWRRGGHALRYVHEFDETALTALARATGFEVTETFCSDGADRKSSIYQTWRLARG